MQIKIWHCLILKQKNNSIGIFCLQKNFIGNIVMKCVSTRIKHWMCGELGEVTDEAQLTFSGVSLKKSIIKTIINACDEKTGLNAEYLQSSLPYDSVVRILSCIQQYSW